MRQEGGTDVSRAIIHNGPDRGMSAGQGGRTGSGQGGVRRTGEADRVRTGDVSGTERPDRVGVRWLSGGAVRPDRGLSGPCPDPLSGCFAVVLQASELGTSVSRGFWMQGHWMG